MKKLFIAIVVLMTGFTANAAIIGDVNNDGEVNISDINAVIDIILRDNSDPSGDVNRDGEVNISDINLIIDILLGGGPSTLTPKDISLDFSPLEEPGETIPDDEDALDYGDYVENTVWATTVRINFDGETATVTGNPSSVIVNVDGAHVTCTNAVFPLNHQEKMSNILLVLSVKQLKVLN